MLGNAIDTVRFERCRLGEPLIPTYTYVYCKWDVVHPPPQQKSEVGCFF